jgi:cation:H+ antiporter
VTTNAAASGAALLVASMAALGANYGLVTRLERLAARWHLSEAMLGLVVALAADSPEISSAVTASVRGQSGIGAGVVLGSNVFNLAALLGLGAVVAGRIALHRRVVIVEGAVAMWVALVSVAVVVTPLGAGVGLVLVLLVVVPYGVIAAVPTHRLGKFGLPDAAAEWLATAEVEQEEEIAPAIHPGPQGSFDGALAALALVVVIGASTVMERSAQTLGRRLGLSDLIVGGVVLAAVTSLPNAVGAVFLAARGRGTALLSEAMNSNTLNVLAGLLIPALFVGLSGSSAGNVTVVAFYAGLTALTLALIGVGRGLSRRAGGLIVVGYIAFVVTAVAL